MGLLLHLSRETQRAADFSEAVAFVKLDRFHHLIQVNRLRPALLLITCPFFGSIRFSTVVF
jgi:hypothetical protein